jgi:hypothetical protein
VQSMPFTVDRAKRLNSEVAHIRLVKDEPRMELTERFTLLTVPAGLRRCALLVHLGTNELQRLRSVAIDHGLFPLVSRSSSLQSRTYEAYGEKISRVFREHDAEGDHPVLWICSSDAIRKQVKAAPAESWVLLDYPDCCVQSEHRSKAFVNECFGKAIVDKAGGDPMLVRKGLREKWKVKLEIPEELAPGRNSERTEATFPFALHIAWRCMP